MATVTYSSVFSVADMDSNVNTSIADVDVENVTVTSTLSACPGMENTTTPGYCPAMGDSFICWPETAVNTTAAVKHYCPIKHTIEIAYRYCPENGNWSTEKSNYNNCLTGNPEQEGIYLDQTVAAWIRDIIFILSSISLVLLVITLFIFMYFRSLHCNRITIHKHLVVSFILRFIHIIISTEPYVTNNPNSYRNFDWLCKTMTVLGQYLSLASMFWMFVEGFYLHHSLVMGVFSTKAPFKLFYYIGWGLPSHFVLGWSLMLYFKLHADCWRGYSQEPSFYIISVPFMILVGVNLIFLVNIIRVLVSKLRANNKVESAKLRKAIKATVILMPLLGLTNLLFFVNPGKGDLEVAYRITNAVLSSSQGIFVSVFYCFMNGEVRRVIKQKWYRFKLQHGLGVSNRRRNSRTTSFFLASTTEDDDEPNDHSAAAEQLRLVRANIELKNELTNNQAAKEQEALSNGTTGYVHTADVFVKKNNNNGDVHFMRLPPSDYYTLTERETVL
ncbi:corticotropin-releasing factor receptor 2-like [Dreissena polymorpha]|uniref:Uncharacterized protein n=1 Tax=Dreissena polymorpha TaxID=45954 RepID=A0A9D4CAJ2_DREPO|nr:corticotropin-releasing factor receptor 2-like [Dreissena polymorpha]KAH3719968.1 hypothetical protein DPMN_062854 [Dreissena polymorpha]